jgi:hypothetical protein
LPFRSRVHSATVFLGRSGLRTDDRCTGKPEILGQRGTVPRRLPPSVTLFTARRTRSFLDWNSGFLAGRKQRGRIRAVGAAAVFRDRAGRSRERQNVPGAPTLASTSQARRRRPADVGEQLLRQASSIRMRILLGTTSACSGCR